VSKESAKRYLTSQIQCDENRGKGQTSQGARVLPISGCPTNCVKPSSRRIQALYSPRDTEYTEMHGEPWRLREISVPSVCLRGENRTSCRRVTARIAESCQGLLLVSPLCDLAPSW